MTAADKIAEARALIEPLTGHTPGPWRKHGNGFQVMAGKTLIASATLGPVKANTRLIAAAPALRDTVAALADLADAQAQEIAKLKAIIARMDALTPRADKTCDQPGITLSEAVQREWRQLRLSPTPSPETAP